MPRFFKRYVSVPRFPGRCAADQIHRLFKFPQMDFEMAIWEMTSLLIAPKKVFKSIYYHVSCAAALWVPIANRAGDVIQKRESSCALPDISSIGH
jgi:hypothetical protein